MAYSGMRDTETRLVSHVDLTKLDHKKFPHFVHDVLKDKWPGLRLFGSSKDGGIDLVADDGEGSRTVFQCKFISGSTSSPRAAWMKEDGKNLRRSLNIDKHGNLVGQALYKPWKDARRPVARYILCHNRATSSLAARETLEEETESLREEIERIFQNEIGGRTGFTHLSKIRVLVYSGDHLRDECERQTLICDKWFGPALPPTIGSVSNEDVDHPGGETFRSYLSGRRLHYYSREKFRSEYPLAHSTFPTEAEILEHIFALPNDRPVFVVAGPGGYGKSRLTLELCRTAVEEHDALAFRLTHHARVEHVAALLKRVPAHSRVLLWVDYLELFEDIDQVVQTIATYHASHGDVAIRVVATCRTSYYRAIAREKYISPLDLTADASSTAEAYRKAVFLHIANKAGLPDAEVFGKKSNYNPVIATFLLYIANGHPSGVRFQEDLRELINHAEYEHDFAAWLLGRLLRNAAVIIPGLTRPELLDFIAPVLASLPARETALSDLKGTGRQSRCVDILMHDRLIERERAAAPSAPVVWNAAHDIITDLIVLRYLDLHAVKSEAIGQIFDNAEKGALIGNAIVTFQRLAEQEAVRDFAWLDFFLTRLTDSPGWVFRTRALLRTNLLGSLDKLRLISAIPAVCEFIEVHPELDYDLFSLAYSSAVQFRSEPADSSEREILLPLLIEALKRRSNSLVGMSAALIYNPRRFEDEALGAIELNGINPELHNVYRAWLNSNLDASKIEASLSTWLFYNRWNAYSTAGVLRAWVGQGIRMRASLQVLKSASKALNDWFAIEGRKISVEAGLLYTAWLRAAANSGHPEAEPTLDALFDAVRDWVSLYPKERVTAGVLYAVLDCARLVGRQEVERALQVFEPIIADWFKGPFAATRSAHWLMTGWLLAAVFDSDCAQRTVVSLKPHLASLVMTAHHTQERTAHLYNDWLLAVVATENKELIARELRFVRPFLLDWLQHKSQSRTGLAGFVLRGWLEAEAKCEPISVEVSELLIELADNWLRTDHPGMSSLSWYVKIALVKLLKTLGKEVPSRHATSSWDTRPIWILSRSKEWAERNPAAAIQRLSGICNEFVLPENINDLDRRRLLNAILVPLRKLGSIPGLVPDLGKLLARTIKHPSVFERGRDDRAGVKLSVSLIDVLEEVMRDGQLAVSDSGDCESLNKFLIFITRCPIVEGELKSTMSRLEGLKQRFPNKAIWRSVDIRNLSEVDTQSEAPSGVTEVAELDELEDEPHED